MLKVKGCLWGSEHILKSIVVMALKTGELCSLSGCTVWLGESYHSMTRITIKPWKERKDGETKIKPSEEKAGSG